MEFWSKALPSACWSASLVSKASSFSVRHPFSQNALWRVKGLPHVSSKSHLSVNPGILNTSILSFPFKSVLTSRWTLVLESHAELKEDASRFQSTERWQQGCNRVLLCLLISAYDLQATRKKHWCHCRLHHEAVWSGGLFSWPQQAPCLSCVVFEGLAYLVTVSCSAILSKHTAYHEQVPHVLLEHQFLQANCPHIILASMPNQSKCLSCKVSPWHHIFSYSLAVLLTTKHLLG